MTAIVRSICAVPKINAAIYALLFVAGLFHSPGRAATIAGDSAADAAYNGGWTNGQNGGSGFGPWQLTVGGSGGHFVSMSSVNAGGSSGNIDDASRSWGLWSTNGVIEAVRSFSGALATGQTFSVAFDNGWINTDRSAGIALRNNAGQTLWEFYFSGGSRQYTINQYGGAVATDIPFTGDGLYLKFTLTGPTSWFVRVNAQVLGSTATFYAYDGYLLSQSDSAIAQFRTWNYEAGAGGNYDSFINKIAINSSTLLPMSGDPWLDSWSLEEVGRYARIYETTAAQSSGVSSTTWSRNSLTQAVPTYSGVQAIYSASNAVYVRSSGLGFQVMGPWYLNAAKTGDFPNFPINQHVLWRIARGATLPGAHILTALGSIGIFVDGVAMFDSRDGYVWTGTAESGNGAGYWNRDAYVNESVTFDPAYAHQEQSGTYHYHANPIALRYMLGDHVTFNTNTKVYAESSAAVSNHSPLLGWVRDGHPIYGPYAYSNPTNPASGVRRMISGFVLRNGQNGSDNLTSVGRTNIPAWAQRAYGVGADQSGPSVSATYPLGRYMEDNAYLGDLGYTKGVDFDLDEYNGRFCVTPEFPNGTYAYFVSIASNGAPVFPYNIGRQFHGATNGGSVVSIPDSVTTNFLGGPAGEESLSGVSASGDNIVMVWNSVEGGGYVVESSSNLVDWVVSASNLSASSTGAVTTYAMSGGGSAMAFQRVRRVSLAEYDSVFSGGAGGNGGIASVSPTSGTRGQTVSLTINLSATATPAVPPQNAPILSATIGTTGGTSLSHVTQYVVTGSFTIPGGAATGAQTVSVTFPGPPENPTQTITYTLTDGFTVN